MVGGTLDARDAEPPINPTTMQIYGPGGRNGYATGWGSDSMERALVEAGVGEGDVLIVVAVDRSADWKETMEQIKETLGLPPTVWLA